MRAERAFSHPPGWAAWQHRGARNGFEVAFLGLQDAGYRLEGETAAVQGGEAWIVRYALDLDGAWATHSASVSRASTSGAHELVLETDGAGRWRLDGTPAAHLDGCLDVDFESSALTNALPVHRLGLEVGEQADAPAAYVRAPGLEVERLEQRYVRLEDAGKRERYHYAAPAFGFECDLTYDEFGLILDYPAIAVRAA